MARFTPQILHHEYCTTKFTPQILHHECYTTKFTSHNLHLNLHHEVYTRFTPKNQTTKFTPRMSHHEIYSTTLTPRNLHHEMYITKLTTRNLHSGFNVRTTSPLGRVPCRPVFLEMTAKVVHMNYKLSQVRGGATTQSTAPPNRIVPCGKRRYLRGSEFCCGPPKAPISAAALKKEGEWRQSRKGGGRMVAVKERLFTKRQFGGPGLAE